MRPALAKVLLLLHDDLSVALEPEGKIPIHVMELMILGAKAHCERVRQCEYDERAKGRVQVIPKDDLPPFRR